MGSIKRKNVSVFFESCRIETPSPHRSGGNTDRSLRVVRVFQLLVVEIEEQLVLDYRPAEGAAKVVKALLRLCEAVPSGMVEVASRIQGVVLEILVECAVKLIGSALADEIENVAASAVLRRGG